MEVYFLLKNARLGGVLFYPPFCAFYFCNFVIIATLFCGLHSNIL